MKKVLIITIMFLCFSFAAFASPLDDSIGDKVQVVLTTKLVIVGELVYADDYKIIVKNNTGRSCINFDYIVYIKY